MNKYAKFLVLIVFICFIILLFNNSRKEIPYGNKELKVHYYAQNSSSGGDRILDINYIVRMKGERFIFSCEGTYSYPASIQDRINSQDNIVEDCDVNKLINKEYNVPLELIMSYSKYQKKSGEFINGPSVYRYEIVNPYLNYGAIIKKFFNF